MSDLSVSPIILSKAWILILDSVIVAYAQNRDFSESEIGQLRNLTSLTDDVQVFMQGEPLLEQDNVSPYKSYKMLTLLLVDVTWYFLEIPQVKVQNYPLLSNLKFIHSSFKLLTFS